MRELVEAAVQAAARAGVTAIIIDGHNGNGNGASAPVAAALPPGAPADAVARFNAATARVQELEGHLRNQSASLQAITGERDTYSARLREAEAKIRSAPAGATTGSPVPTAPSLDGQPISILGLDEEEIAKKVLKKGYDTVGKLRVALLEGKLASEVKLSKDRIIATWEALAGKVPPATLLPGGGGVPVGTPPSATAAVGLPAGHVDRPWPERIAAARKKQGQRDVLMADVARLEAELATCTDQTRRAAIDAEVKGKNSTLDTIRGQVFCLLWSGGLYSNPNTAPKNPRDVNVDAALKDAGLVHLMETPPAPQDAPATAPAPQTPPATA